MPSFGSRSKHNLIGVHPDIISVLEEAIRYYDFTVLEGLRLPERQRELVSTGNSLTLASKHLEQVDGFSHAVDVAPYPIDWEDTEEFFYLAGLIEGIARVKGIKLKWGGRWRNLKDCPHFELEDN